MNRPTKKSRADRANGPKITIRNDLIAAVKRCIEEEKGSRKP